LAHARAVFELDHGAGALAVVLLDRDLNGSR
jgi:hypothetical protein